MRRCAVRNKNCNSVSKPGSIVTRMISTVLVGHENAEAEVLFNLNPPIESLKSSSVARDLAPQLPENRSS